eukprot:CAMPEP_0116153124 /NCGR_PEP_ID=MMETSP0329-20121206/21053_1 /TAXON_ID=697910 /ORGANISM="Pseudo-nitzschia arenysensis, Strain B593" /LENGTH=507 /DNA_ID=CAMNT_0003649963 /DNA_START=97 /DNA_END=1620 /DNA_ORIENTATION=+
MEQITRASGKVQQSKEIQSKRWPFSLKANLNPFHHNDSSFLQPSTERQNATGYTLSYCNPFSILLRPTRNRMQTQDTGHTTNGTDASDISNDHDNQTRTIQAPTTATTNDNKTLISNRDLSKNTGDADTRQEQGTNFATKSAADLENGRTRPFFDTSGQGKIGSHNSGDSELEVPKLLADRVVAIQIPNTSMQTSDFLSRATTDDSADTKDSVSPTANRPEFEPKSVCARAISGLDGNRISQDRLTDKSDGKATGNKKIGSDISKSEKKAGVNFGSWDLTEHRQFLHLHSIHGPDFEKISKLMSNRNPLQVEAYAYCSCKGKSLRHWSCEEYENFITRVPQRWFKKTGWSKDEVKERIQRKSDLNKKPTVMIGSDGALSSTLKSLPDRSKIKSRAEGAQHRNLQGKGRVSNIKNSLLRELAPFNLSPQIKGEQRTCTSKRRKRPGFTVSFSEKNLNSLADGNGDSDGNGDKQHGQLYRRSRRTKKSNMRNYIGGLGEQRKERKRRLQ